MNVGASHFDTSTKKRLFYGCFSEHQLPPDGRGGGAGVRGSAVGGLLPAVAHPHRPAARQAGRVREKPAQAIVGAGTTRQLHEGLSSNTS